MGFLETIREDIESVFDRDPAATSTVSVLLCYPGLHAVWFHRAESLVMEEQPQVSGAFWLASGALLDRH